MYICLNILPFERRKYINLAIDKKKSNKLPKKYQ